MKIEDSTRSYYETQAADYFHTTHAADLQYVWDMLSRRLGLPALILDLGCGSGRDLRYFSNLGFSTVGLDYSFELLKLARDFSGQPVVQADIRALPFADSAFDAIWAVASLLHLPRSIIPHVLLQLRQILKPGGLLLTSVKSGKGEVVDAKGRYTAFYALEEWQRFLLQADYRVAEVAQSVERRPSFDGALEEIRWITVLAAT